MSAVLGYDFIISTVSGNTATPVAGQRNGTISISGDTVETTVKGGGFAKTYIPTYHSWEVTLSGVYDLTDTNSLASALTAGSVVKIECKLGASSADTYTGDGYVTSFSSSGDQGDIVTYDITIQGTGLLTIA